MRGTDGGQGQLFSYVSLEHRIPADHPLRARQALVEPILAALSPRFAALYAADGRPSIPPEQLLRALLRQVLYTVRSERQLMEQLDFNLLYRWFVGLPMDAAVWHPTTFTKNRDRLLAGDIAAAFLTAVVQAAQRRRLLSGEYFTVDGTMLEAWASQKSFQPTAGPGGDRDDDPRNPSVNFRGERRSNATHASTTDPDARLAKKGAGKEAKLSYQASVLTDNRHGLVVLTMVDPADGPQVEVAQAEPLLQALAAERGPHARPATVVPTAATIRRGLLTPPAAAASPPMSREWSIEPARSTDARRATPAMPSANASGNASSQRLAGPRRWARCGNSAIADGRRSTGCSPS